MSESVLLQMRVDSDLKAEATKILETMGLELPTAIRMFLKRIVLERGLPFPTTLPLDNDSESSKREVQVIHTPAKRALRIPREAVEYLIRQIPAGRITRQEEIERYFQKKYSVERVELEQVPFALTIADPTYPWWRVVSSRGFLPSRSRFYSDEAHAEKLRTEGLSVSMGGPNKAIYKVENYRSLIYDFSDIDIELQVSVDPSITF